MYVVGVRWYLFDIVIFGKGCERDKIIRVIKSRRMNSAVHGTQKLYIYIYVCVCVCVCVSERERENVYVSVSVCMCVSVCVSVCVSE